MAMVNEATLLEKIRALPHDQVGEAEDFVDFLRQKISDHGLAAATTRLSEGALSTVWDNPSDEAHDDL